MERDDDVRLACFLALDALRAQLGEELPYQSALAQGFQYSGRRIPFPNYQKGIYRAGAQHGPAALSINTSFKSPYGDEETPLGFLYAYRAGPIDQPDNRALRTAHELQVPVVYFVGTRPGSYRPVYPCYIAEDDPARRTVLVTPGVMDETQFEPAAVRLEDELSRRYLVRETKVRLHQARFRGLVLPAYRDQCTICQLKETRLLDAAHIIGDSDSEGAAAVTNGLSLCTIHHRAFDQDLVGISPDYRVHVARRLLEDEDGPMLDLLKGFHQRTIELPRPSAMPDRERLAERFERFEKRG